MSESTSPAASSEPSHFASETPLQISSMPLDLLSAEPQVRKHFDPEKITQLAESLKAQGMVQPIVATAREDGTHRIIAGERRYRAAKEAGLSHVPVIVRTDLRNVDVAVIQLVENLQREGLSLSEEAAGCAALLKQIEQRDLLDDSTDPRTPLEIAAEQLGKSKAWVSRRVGILELPEEVRELVESGKLLEVDIAHDIAAMQKFSKVDFNRTIKEFSRDDEWARYPTRADIRTRLKYSKVAFEETQAEQKKLADYPKLAAKVAREKQAAKAERASFAERQKQADKLNEQGKQIGEELLRLGLAATGKDWSKTKSERELPLSVWHSSHHNPHEDGALPSSAEGDKYSVNFNGTIDDIAPALNKIQPGASLQVDLEITEAEARAIEKLLGRKIVCNVLFQAVGKKLRAAWTPAAAPEKKTGKASGSKNGVGLIDDFITFSIVKKPGAKLKAADAHAAYVKFSKKHGVPVTAFNDNAWGEAIEQAGITKKRIASGVHYLDVALIAA